MSRYAENTSVSVDRSRGEIERTLMRYGAMIRIHQGACWEWIGPLDRNGYGVASTGKTTSGRAHRVIYEAFRGPIPEGMTLDHICHTTLCAGGVGCPHRRCVNPRHLRPTTVGENARRASSGSNALRAKNQCKWGHDMTAENTYVSPGGQRHCRRCRARRDLNRRPR